MIIKRIIAAITIILVVLAIILIKQKAKQLPRDKQQQEIKK